MEILAALVALVVGVLTGALVASRRSAGQVESARVEAARASGQLVAERAAHAERLDGVREDHQRLAEQFRALAADALASNNEQFLALAHQRLAASQQSQVGELAQREQAVRALVEPLSRTLDAVRHELTTAEKARLEGQAALGEQVRAMRASSEQLRAETSQLVTALRSSQVRGRWGEQQLRRVVESAGMLANVDFVEQDQVRTDDGLLRPDMVVKLAGGKNVVVDAKVAFLGFLEASQAADESVRAARLKAHARHVRAHVDDLAAKRYWDQFAPAPEFVVMFVPAEAFLHAAVEEDPTLVEHAFERNVVIATPMTLLAMLRTIAYAWRQDALASNAQQVLTLGKELHGRLATMGSHLAKLGRAIDSAAGAYNQTVSSLETRVLVSARRFADLQVVDADLPTPPPANPQLSAVSAPELLASASDRYVAFDERGTASTRLAAADAMPSAD
ncbi:DNA recombination protein RmuC [Cellulomonas chengniuliangii]|uniref:DNA recombination protein RmuC n=1 Tax=Cellulomonas chengniuliangii TaxID=2968084 RepID=A0ABY5L371_9CELL|nr:DNA recombination protein RmuC [Cellulomonas chengniuliangii]MCC2307062.1 DNA recombination protein RmuC [Cellulomonas chengniuliangii]MCC2316445.1 DNA recombination protein RmuC [Cellulomonas chengniuliangii]UUI76136.1 DNA recombination protein RmuC [Cellulomonas chengniuliangii]